MIPYIFLHDFLFRITYIQITNISSCPLSILLCTHFEERFNKAQCPVFCLIYHFGMDIYLCVLWVELQCYISFFCSLSNYVYFLRLIKLLKKYELERTLKG